jgi:hypothetical protein
MTDTDCHCCEHQEIASPLFSFSDFRYRSHMFGAACTSCTFNTSRASTQHHRSVNKLCVPSGERNDVLQHCRVSGNAPRGHSSPATHREVVVLVYTSCIGISRNRAVSCVLIRSSCLSDTAQMIAIMYIQLIAQQLHV